MRLTSGHWACRCNRETRHRGICNARAAAPGFAPAPEEGISFETPPKEELGSVAEEPCQDTNDSEQGDAGRQISSCIG